MYSVLSGMGTAYLSLDAVGLAGLSGIYRVGDEEALERELHIGLPADEADVLRRGDCAFFNVCYITNLREKPPTPVNK